MADLLHKVGVNHRYGKSLYDLEIGIGNHQPLRPLPLEIHLDARLRSVALEIQNHAVAELRVPHAAAEAHVAGRRLLEIRAARESRARYLHARTNLLHELGGQLVDEARG